MVYNTIELLLSYYTASTDK